MPRPVEDYTTSRVLTMDYVHGRKVTAFSPLMRLEIDGSVLALGSGRAVADPTNESAKPEVLSL